jgi:hypothetical protein
LFGERFDQRAKHLLKVGDLLKSLDRLWLHLREVVA